MIKCTCFFCNTSFIYFFLHKTEYRMYRISHTILRIIQCLYCTEPIDHGQKWHGEITLSCNCYLQCPCYPSSLSFIKFSSLNSFKKKMILGIGGHEQTNVSCTCFCNMPLIFSTSVERIVSNCCWL